MKLKSIFTHIFLIVSCIIFGFPLFWMIISMTNTTSEIAQGKLTPGTNFISNTMTVIQDTDFLSAFGSSLFIAIATTLLSLAITSLAAYSFQIYYSKLREGLYNIIILSMMIPFAALMIPLYKQIVNFGLLDSYLAVILQLSAPVFLLFFFRQSFKAFPLEMVEAARIDGASEVKIFRKVAMPSMKSTYAAAAVYAFMMSWNNYLWPLLALKSADKKTLPLVISTISSSYIPDYGAQMVLIVFSTIPMLILFFALQKHFVQGMVGSSK